MKKGLCAALGDFDGVHIGHSAVISAAVQSCGKLIPAVYTFTQNCKNSRLLTDNRTKEAIIKSYGVKEIIFDNFEKIKELSPLLFVTDILNKKYNIRTVVCGEDFRFGKDAAGDVTLLQELCSKLDMKLIIVPAFNIKGKKVSSSDIRKHIECGDMESAAQLLGRRFTVSGNVGHGKSLGRTRQAPTVNIQFDTNCIVPAYGVYITKTSFDGKPYNSISNVGVRPSVENTDTPNIETNIFEFDGNLYGKYITVEFIKMIRPEIKFDSTDDLFGQIKKDIEQAKNYFSGEINE